jgi:hypothetical protein
MRQTNVLQSTLQRLAMPHVFQSIDLIWVQQLDITIWEERERDIAPSRLR